MTCPFFSYGQFGVSFYQSNLPFVGFSYEFNNKLRPEVRLGTDNYFDATSVVQCESQTALLTSLR